ncbi:MAG: hypothetical protein VX768_11015 [Planctomycetota bacterium]|nr:hypothetical protein [Planctomycetota bacterium]
MNRLRLYFGMAFWSIAILSIVLMPVFLSNNPWLKSIGRVREYVASERQSITIDFRNPCYVKQGDPIYIRTEYGWKRIGQVVSEHYNEEGYLLATDSASAVLFGDAPPITGDCYMTLHETPGNFEWALKKILPESKRKEIITELKDTFELHQREIIEGFTPVVMDTLKEIGKILQEDLKNSVTENREQLQKIAARYQEGFVDKRLVPLLREEIWPIIEARSQPVLDEVGSEIWQKASLWRFGWRLAYDKFPLTNSNLVQQEWNRFVQKDAMPVVESHADDFYRLATNILREIAENPQVKAAGKEGVQQLLNDSEIQSLIQETLWKILFENQRLNEVIRKNLSHERTIQVMRETSEKFEDKLREIGDNLFGTFEEGITPEFAGVLRAEILRRDKRWIVLRYRENDSGPAPDPSLDPLDSIDTVEGFYTSDVTDRPEFVRYRNE